MSLTLAIDCSMRWISLGLADAGFLYGEDNTNTGPKQSKILADSVKRFLLKHNFTLSDIEQIAITTGPGYYTGIRVGISYATLLAESLGIKTVPINTLQVIAWELTTAGITVAPVIRARKNAVYAALYSSMETKTLQPGFYEIEEFISLISSDEYKQDKIIVAATGEADTDEFITIKNAGFSLVKNLPALGLKLAIASQNFERVDPAQVTATYLREPS